MIIYFVCISGKLSPFAYTNSSEDQNLSRHDDFGDLDDLDLAPHSSQSDQDNATKVQLNHRELAKLPDWATDVS